MNFLEISWILYDINLLPLQASVPIMATQMRVRQACIRV